MKKVIFVFMILALTFGCVKENLKKDNSKGATIQKKEQIKEAPVVKKSAVKNTIKK